MLVTGREQNVPETRSRSTERTKNVTVTTSASFRSDQDSTNFDIRDYLIERCVTDSNPAAADRPTAAEADDDDSDEVDGDDKTDDGPSSSSQVPEPLQEPCKRSSTLPSQRFSDSELMRRTYCQAGATATFPGRPGSAFSAADSRAKKHRWKLLRKALNLFSLDELTDDGAGDAVTACDSDDTRDAAAHNSHLNGRSISVESLPGSVRSPSHVSCQLHHHRHHFVRATKLPRVI